MSCSVFHGISVFFMDHLWDTPGSSSIERPPQDFLAEKQIYALTTPESLGKPRVSHSGILKVPKVPIKTSIHPCFFQGHEFAGWRFSTLPHLRRSFVWALKWGNLRVHWMTAVKVIDHQTTNINTPTNIRALPTYQLCTAHRFFWTLGMRRCQGKGFFCCSNHRVGSWMPQRQSFPSTVGLFPTSMFGGRNLSNWISNVDPWPLKTWSHLSKL